MRLPEMDGRAVKLLMLLTEIVGVDRFPAQSVLVDRFPARSVLVDVFPKNASLPVMLLVAIVEAVMYLLMMVDATRLTVEMLLVTIWPDGGLPIPGGYVQ